MFNLHAIRFQTLLSAIMSLSRNLTLPYLQSPSPQQPDHAT